MLSAAAGAATTAVAAAPAVTADQVQRALAAQMANIWRSYQSPHTAPCRLSQHQQPTTWRQRPVRLSVRAAANR